MFTYFFALSLLVSLFYPSRLSYLTWYQTQWISSSKILKFFLIFSFISKVFNFWDFPNFTLPISLLILSLITFQELICSFIFIYHKITLFYGNQILHFSILNRVLYLNFPPYLKLSLCHIKNFLKVLIFSFKLQVIYSNVVSFQCACLYFQKNVDGKLSLLAELIKYQ